MDIEVIFRKKSFEDKTGYVDIKKADGSIISVDCSQEGEYEPQYATLQANEELRDLIRRRNNEVARLDKELKAVTLEAYGLKEERDKSILTIRSLDSNVERWLGKVVSMQEEVGVVQFAINRIKQKYSALCWRFIGDDSTLIMDMDLSLRVQVLLADANVRTFSQLRGMSEIDLLKLPRCGEKALREIKAAVEAELNHD